MLLLDQFFLLPTITETEGTNVMVSGNVLDELCFSRQTDVRLAIGTQCSEKLGTESLKTLQHIQSNQKKKNKTRSCNWSREDQLNLLLPSGDDRGGYLFTEEMLELAPFVKVVFRIR